MAKEKQITQEVQEDVQEVQFVVAEWITNKGQCIKGEKVELTPSQYAHLKQKGFVK